MEDDISIIKSLIAICGNEGLPLEELERDFREMADKRLNVRQYGFSCVEDLLRSCPQISLKKTCNGIVCHVNDGKISHLVDLVSRTKKKTTRKRVRKVYHTPQRARNYFSPHSSSRGPCLTQPSRKPLSSNHYESNYQYKRPASPKPYRSYQDSTKPVRRDENKFSPRSSSREPCLTQPSRKPLSSNHYQSNYQYKRPASPKPYRSFGASRNENKVTNVNISREQSQYRPTLSARKQEAAMSSTSKFSKERIVHERSNAQQATYRQNTTGRASQYSYNNQPSKSLVKSDSSGWSSEDEPVNLGRCSVQSSATLPQNLNQPCRVLQPAKQGTSFSKVHRIQSTSTNESDSDWSSDPEASVETNSKTKVSEAFSSLKLYGSQASVETNSMTKLSEGLSSLRLYGSPASLNSYGHPSFKNESPPLKDSVSQHVSQHVPLVSGGVGRGKCVTSMGYEAPPTPGVTVTGSPSKRETFVSSLNGSQTIVVRISNESRAVSMDPQCSNPSFKDYEYSEPSFKDYQFVGDFFLFEIARVCLGFAETSGHLCKPWSNIQELEENVTKIKPSKKILMMVGITDILEGSDITKMRDQMNSLLIKLSSHKVLLLTVPIPPRFIKVEYNEALKTILQYNRWLLSLSSTHKSVDVLDVEPLIQCDKRFFKSIFKGPSLPGPSVDTLAEGGCWIIMDEVYSFLKNK